MKSKDLSQRYQDLIAHWNHLRDRESFFPFQKIPRIQLPKTDRRLSVLYILTMSQHCMGNIIIIIIGFHSSETLIFQVFYKIYQSDPQFQTHLVIYYLTTRCRQRNKILITNTAMLSQAPSHTSQNLRAANFRGHVSSSEEKQIKDSFEN